MKYWVLLTMAIGFCLLTSASPLEDYSLRSTYKKYIRAVEGRDLAGLEATLSKMNEFFYLNVRGQLITSRHEYVKGHAEWFKNRNWKIDFDQPLIREMGNLGITMAIFHLQEKGCDGKCQNLSAYFTMIFIHEEGKWKIMADVCTPIK
jgi:ketosteroid isomerase-like protein